MDIQVNKLDRAYTISEELDRETFETSRKMSQDLVRIVNNIKEHWHGDDATIHVNQWIEEYNKCGKYFVELSKTTNFLQNYFVDLQSCRAKTSNNTRIGDKTQRMYGFEKLPMIETTGEYYYDDRLKTDYADLQELCTNYDRFIDTTDKKVKEVLTNWSVGVGRDEVGNYYTKVNNYSTKLSREFRALNDSLGDIIQNIERVSS